MNEKKITIKPDESNAEQLVDNTTDAAVAELNKDTLSAAVKPEPIKLDEQTPEQLTFDDAVNTVEAAPESIEAAKSDDQDAGDVVKFDAASNITPEEFAEKLSRCGIDITAVSLVNEIKDAGLAKFADGAEFIPNKKGINSGLFKIVIENSFNENGKLHSNWHGVITPKGQNIFFNGLMSDLAIQDTD